MDAAVAAAEASGYEVARNAPYAGGYITARHGRPPSGVHALQLELDRSLYLDEELHSPGEGFDHASRMIADVAAALAAKALEPAQAIAAE
jgi:N-formylglutamate amidohydrolase